MKLSIFDAYNIRARLSVYLIIIAPLLFTIIKLFSIESFLLSSVFIAVVLAFSNFLFIYQRFVNRKKRYKNTAAEFLYIHDKHIKKETKKRYYRKLSQIDDSFQIFLQPDDSDAFKQVCESAVQWLINNTRNNKLVQEENIQYGFYCGLYNFKKLGIVIDISCIIVVTIIKIVYPELIETTQFWILFIINTLFLPFWIFGVREKIRDFLSEKYAYALLGSIDSIPTNN